MNLEKFDNYLNEVYNFIKDNPIKFIVFTIYLIGLGYNILYYKEFSIPIVKYSSLYDFFIEPIHRTLPFILTTISLVLWGVAIYSQYKNPIFKQKIFSFIILGIFTLSIILAYICDFEFTTIIFSSTQKNIILFNIMIFVFLFAWPLRNKKFIYLITYLSFIILNTFMASKSEYKEFYSENRKPFSKNEIIQFYFDNKEYTECDSLLLIGENNNYIFMYSPKIAKSIIYNKSKCKNIAYIK